MNIYERLKADHEHQRNLLERLVGTEGDSEQRNKLWREIKVELEAHAAAEEQTLYAELMSHPDGSDQARHSVAEHKEATDLIEELDDIGMSSSAWLQKLKHLKERVIHHIDEEEEDVFPRAKRLISADCAERLTKNFNERKPIEKRDEQAA